MRAMSRVGRVRHQDTPLGFSQLLPVTLQQASCKSLFITNRCTDPGLCSCFTGRLWTANRCITKLLYALFACAQHYTGSQASDTATDITYLLQIRNIKCNHAWTDAYRYQTQLLKRKSPIETSQLFIPELLAAVTPGWATSLMSVEHSMIYAV